MENLFLYDIECYPNYFCVGLKNYNTKQIEFYEISERRNDIVKIKDRFTNYTGFLISFNGIHYDNMVLKYLLNNFEKFSKYTYESICFELKWFSDKLINEDYDDLIKQIKYQKVIWTDIDLFLYWSKMLRLSKKISLKSLGIQLGYPVVQELPFPPNKILNVEDIEIVEKYNSTHDLGILELLTTKMMPDIELRGYILEEYGLECWSMDAPKIASEYLLEHACKASYNPRSEIPYWKYKKNVRDFRYTPTVWKVGDYLPQVNFKTEFFKNIHHHFLNLRSDNQSVKDVLLEQNSKENLIISISSGGLHTVNNNQKYKEDDEYYIIDADIASLYPTLFRQYKFLRSELQIVLNKYLEIIDDRIEAKRTGNKKKDLFLKLILNSFSGLVDSNVTWMYSPEQILALRVFGQLIQLRFIEELNEIGITTIFSNTDGTLAKVPKNLLPKYKEIAMNIAKEFQVEWEFCMLEFINFSNTNTYISKIYKEFMLDENLKEINVKEKGKIKRKGKFFRIYEDIPLGDSVDCLIINKALQAYYVDGIEPEEYISNPEKYKHHIYDYCKSNKISKNYVVYHNNQVVQNLNRYYFSRNAPYLFKQKNGIGTMQHVNVGQGVILYNSHNENISWNERKINYTYYICSAKDIITNVDNHNQLTLF